MMVERASRSVMGSDMPCDAYAVYPDPVGRSAQMLPTPARYRSQQDEVAPMFRDLDGVHLKAVLTDG